MITLDATPALLDHLNRPLAADLLTELDTFDLMEDAL